MQNGLKLELLILEADFEVMRSIAVFVLQSIAVFFNDLIGDVKSQSHPLDTVIVSVTGKGFKIGIEVLC